MLPYYAVARYWHTLRYLRPVQIYGRAWFRLARPRPDLAPPPQPREITGGWTRCARSQSMFGPDRFRFLSVERQLSSGTDWNRADWPKLWLYNAHYFDDLVAKGAEARVPWHKDLIERWITENPPGFGNGWEPYPTSLRVVNWIKWSASGNELSARALHSLAVQVRYLRRRLEIHLLGNHLWANAKALVFAGVFFDGPEAARWRTKGLRLFRQELAEQVLADGGHFERSPMYHAILLEDVLDLVQLAARYPGVLPSNDVSRWHQVAGRMLQWLQGMTHPDGGITFFNDAAFGVAAPLAELRRYAEAVGVDVPELAASASKAMSASGYVRLETPDAVLIMDVAPIGPDYLPGHAHADTLSLELSLFGRRLFVNSGTSGYGVGPERERQRGTEAHNTVSIDGQDSSEVWSGFRVARRARVKNVAVDLENARVQAEHDGYCRLPGRPVHRRSTELAANTLTIVDEIDGKGEHLVQGVWHLHPNVEIRSIPDEANTFLLSLPVEGGERAAKLVIAGPMHVELASSTWHPEFGHSVPSRKLVLNYSGRLPVVFTTHLYW